MNPSARELAVVADLIRDRLTGAMIQKITQPGPTRLVLLLHRASAGKTRLLIDVTRNAVHFHPTELAFENPASAPPFCLQLRKLIGNGRVREITATPGDRVVTLSIDKKTDDRIETVQLVCELIRAHPCLFLVDSKGMIVAASGSVHSEKRDLARGRPYTPPSLPPQVSETREPFARLEGWTPDDLFTRLDDEVAAMTTEGLGTKAVERALTKELKRQYKRISKVEADVRDLETGEELLRQGELIKGAWDRLQKGMESIEVDDWNAEESTTVTIALDPLKEPHENVQALFDRAKKKMRGVEVARTRLVECKARLAELLELQAEIESAKSHAPADLVERGRALGLKIEAPATPAKKKKPKQAPRVPYFVFTSKDGLAIWVGRTSRDNDVLTFKHAKGNEWWLHADGYAGSHVVIKTTDEPIPEQTLIDAATLAVEYSKAPSGGKQAVSYTRRRFVTKFKGSNPGQVLLKTHKTFRVVFEPERLERLKKSR